MAMLDLIGGDGGGGLKIGSDATNYVTFLVSAGGDLTIEPTGGDTNVTGKLLISGRLGIATKDIETTASNFVSAHIGGGGYLLAKTTSTQLGLWAGNNVYYDGTWKYRSGGEGASLLSYGRGDFSFQVAASGTIDTEIAWTTGLTITSAGHLKPLLPTSTSGLAAGTLWNDAGTVKVA